jgi:uroporphyrinogen decarboxylase
MNSRERVLRAFKKIEGLPDRVPIQFDLCRSLTEQFGAALGITPEYALSYYEDLTYRISANEIRTRLGSDCVVVGGTVASGFTPERIDETVTTNEFGMHMKPGVLYVDVVKGPLEHVESVDDIDAYAFPDAYAPGRFDAAKRDIARFGNEFFVIGDAELSLFELAWHMTGLEKYLIALMTEEEWVETLNDKIEAWTLGIAMQLASIGVDAVWLGEDLGTQVSLLIDPELWRERFKPRYARMIGRLKEEYPNLIIIFHSDGAVAPLRCTIPCSPMCPDRIRSCSNAPMVTRSVSLEGWTSKRCCPPEMPTPSVATCNFWPRHSARAAVICLLPPISCSRMLHPTRSGR